MKTFPVLSCAMLLSGCVSFTPEITRQEFDDLKNSVHSIRNEEAGIVQSTQDRLEQLEYFIAHDKCFIDYGICLGEKKLKQKTCWARHEACVIDVFHQWKKESK